MATELQGLGFLTPFPGSKRQLLPQILPVIPPHKTYVELFAGGAAIFFSKPQAEKSVLNDLDPSLMEFYRKFSCKAVAECKRIKDVCGFARKARARVREGSGDVCDQVAARRFSIVSDIFGGMKTDECKIRLMVPKRLERICADAEARLKQATITNLDFREAAKRFDEKDTFFFADPPYPGTTPPTKFKANGASPKDVCDLARKLKGKVLITYNDVPATRTACTGRGLHVKAIPSRHQSKHVTGGKTATTELLISNFPLPNGRN